MDYRNWETQFIKSCPYLLPCGICDKTDETPCVQYGIQKLEQKYVDNGDDSCDTCMYEDRKSCEEPCASCSHNHVNRWRLNETAD